MKALLSWVQQSIALLGVLFAPKQTKGLRAL
jgi:hypothetical protein